MKSPFLSEIVRLKNLADANPDNILFASKVWENRKYIYQYFKQWSKEVDNCLWFEHAEIDSNLLRWKSRLFPRDPHRSAKIIIRAGKIFSKNVWNINQKE